MNKLLENIEESYLILRAAAGSYPKTIAYKLRGVGRRVTASAIEKWFVNSVSDIPRANWLQTAKQNLYAIYEATPAGFELVLTDLEIFLKELRRRGKVQSRTIYALPNPIRDEFERVTIRIRSELTKLEDLCAA